MVDLTVGQQVLVRFIMPSTVMIDEVQPSYMVYLMNARATTLDTQILSFESDSDDSAV